MSQSRYPVRARSANQKYQDGASNKLLDLVCEEHGTGTLDRGRSPTRRGTANSLAEVVTNTNKEVGNNLEVIDGDLSDKIDKLLISESRGLKFENKHDIENLCARAGLGVGLPEGACGGLSTTVGKDMPEVFKLLYAILLKHAGDINSITSLYKRLE